MPTEEEIRATAAEAYQNYLNSGSASTSVPPDPNSIDSISEERAKRTGVTMEGIVDGTGGLSDATKADAVAIPQESGVTPGSAIETITDRGDSTVSTGAALQAGTQKDIAISRITPEMLSGAAEAETVVGKVSKELDQIEDITVDPITGAKLTDEQVADAKASHEAIRNATLSEGALATTQTGTASSFLGDTPKASLTGKLIEAAQIEDGDIAQGIAAKIEEEGLPDLEDIDVASIEVATIFQELPTEALVSTQMDTLLAGLEDGKTPAWALPAVQAVEAKMVARGMSASTVGQTQLFAAIVQSAFPIANANAQAVKERAAQNLQNAQQKAVTDAQIESDLTGLNVQQGIVKFQTIADIRGKNAQLAQQMDMANMSEKNQISLANLQATSEADRANLDAVTKVELANLESELRVGTLNAQLSNAMGVANLSAAQQTSIANAATVANMDFTKLTLDQQTELANSQWMQTASVANMNNEQQSIIQNATLKANADIATADFNTRLQIDNAKNFLAMDMTNLSNAQQANILNAQQRQQTMLSNQAAQNAAKQFNATSENQTNQFMTSIKLQTSLHNTAQVNAMSQFNVSQTNAMTQFNDEKDFQRDQWNASNKQAIEQSNIAWRRQANTADTAAKNAINQQNALNAFNLEKGALDSLWQEVRDQAAFENQNWSDYQTQVTNLYATALSHEGYASQGNWSKAQTLVETFKGMFG